MTPIRITGEPLSETFFDGPPILKKISDPTGLTTGRWTVHRENLVFVGGIPAVWVWRAKPEPARGVVDDQLKKSWRDFTIFEKALEYAIYKARENIR